MKVLACFILSLLTIGTKGCLTRRKRPENSLVSCIFDKGSDRYTHCKYICRQGYHFKELVEEKVQLCVNGTWIPENIGDCVAQSQPETSVTNPCSARPKQPKNSYSSCSFHRNHTEYTRCVYFCVKGFYFYESEVRRIQSCVNHAWIPEKVGNCVSQAENIRSCTSRPKRPKNSFSTCKFDKNLEGYASCTYICKNDYYFHGEVNEKTQYCVNGKWEPGELSDCVYKTERYSAAAFSCFLKPTKVPQKSFDWCIFDEESGEYTECAYVCSMGYHFDGMINEKKRICVDGKWMPEEIGDCKDQSRKFAVGVGPCSSRPYLPKNSYVSCTLERDSVLSDHRQVKRNCTYVCRKGYSFPDTNDINTQQCVDDNWTPTDLGDCVNPSYDPDLVENACPSVPAKRPRNAAIHFNYNASVGGFTDCKYVCFVGLNFHGRVNEKTQICVDGTWIPENVGDCS